MSTKNESLSIEMNETMSSNYDLNSKISSDRDALKNSQQYISNLQNFSQNLQNLQQNVQNVIQQTINNNSDLSGGQIKAEANTRCLNTNQKSMISPEIHTHFKKQKIQNLKNEDYLSSSSSSSQQPINSSNDCGLNLFNQITQQHQQQFTNNQLKSQLFNQFDERHNEEVNNQLNQVSSSNNSKINKPQTSYSESLSSESSSNQCISPAPSDAQGEQSNQFPINLIKNQDTSSLSSNETSKDDLQTDHKDRLDKLDSSTNSSTNCSSIYGTLMPSNHKFSIQSTNSGDSSSSNALDNIELIFTKQPAKYHRARYMTEGSRGPIRDKSGKSFPTIKLKGYNSRPVKAYCYLIDDKQINQPHLFYQASKLTSRCLTNCSEVKFDNTIALEFELHPRSGMELMIDCLGIVKQRLFEIQQQQNNQEKSHFKTPYCRLAFECYIPEYNHIAKTWSDTIHCKQMMRAPEIHRMSIKECHISGDKELFIIGKNFTKDIKLYFSYGNQWQEQVTPVKELFHQAHIVCNVPKLDQQVMNSLGKMTTDKDGQTTKRLTVELYAVCDNKMSGKEQFTYYS